MKIQRANSSVDLSSKNTQVQVGYSSSYDIQQVSIKNKTKSNNNNRMIILFIALLSFLIVLIAINWSQHKKQQIRQHNLLLQQIKEHTKQIQNKQNQSRNQIQKSNLKVQINNFIRNQIRKQLSKAQYEIKQNVKKEIGIIHQVKNQSSKIPIRDLKSPITEDFSSFYCLKRPLVPNTLPPKGQRDFLINTRYGFQLYGDAAQGNGEYMTTTMMRQGTFEPEGINLMGRLLRPGYKVLNLGAHTGLEALIAANIVGQKANKLLKHACHQQFQLNNFTQRAKIYKIAVSDVKRKSKIQIDLTNTGGNTLQQHAVSLSKRPGIYTEQVQLDLVDNIVPPNVQIDLALVDVEHHEVQTLIGMMGVIQRSPYLVIMIQWSYAWNESPNIEKAKKIIKFLLDKGYTFYSYSGFDAIKCIVGSYKPFKDPLNQLLTIQYSNLLIAPSTVILP